LQFIKRVATFYTYFFYIIYPILLVKLVLYSMIVGHALESSSFNTVYDVMLYTCYSSFFDTPGWFKVTYRHWYSLVHI